MNCVGAMSFGKAFRMILIFHGVWPACGLVSKAARENVRFATGIILEHRHGGLGAHSDA